MALRSHRGPNSQTISNATLRDRPRAFLEALKAELRAPFTKMFLDEPGRFQWLLPDTKIFFVAFCLMRERTGEVDLLELRFPLCNLEGVAVLGEPEIIKHMEREIPRGSFCYNLGPACLVNDPLNALDLDSSDDAILRAVDPMISGFKQADAMCREDFGELISVAAIDSAGFRWLRNATPPAVPQPIEDPLVRIFRACKRAFNRVKTLKGMAA
jgi:hypothetical protein